MNIAFHITDLPGAGPIAVDTNGGSGSAPAAGGAADGGAPRVNAPSDTSDASGGATVDIGGPPQWLTEAIGGEGKEGAPTAAEPTVAQSDTRDGGSAPAF